MRNNDSTHKAETYEPPTLKVVGTLQEITKQGHAANADLQNGKANTAFSV